MKPLVGPTDQMARTRSASERALKRVAIVEQQLLLRFNRSTNNKQEDGQSAASADRNMAPTLEGKDLKFIATTQVKVPQREIMKLYVGNYLNLTLKQRRQVTSFIQAQRAKHAKEIFLKELSAIGRTFNNQVKNSQGESPLVANSRIVGVKDPFKLKLEQITI